MLMGRYLITSGSKCGQSLSWFLGPESVLSRVFKEWTVSR
jgi:hypothetical protein